MNKVEYCKLILEQVAQEISFLNKHNHCEEVPVSQNCPFCLPIVDNQKIIGFNCNRLQKLHDFREQISNQIVQYNMRDRLNQPETPVSDSNEP